MKLYKIFTLVCCFSLLSFNTDKKKHEKTKSIKKEYTVNNDATVYLNNKYGDISVTTWNENKVKITVKITVKGNDLEAVDKKLDAINVNFESSKSLVEATTRIEKTNSNWSWWGSSNKVNYKINYFIKMPKTNNLDVYNKYGDIVLTELDGKTNIKCNYGNVQADRLLNKSNTIELNYCGNSQFDWINTATIDADYSKIIINEAKHIKSNTDYTTIKIGTIDNFTFNSDYGSINVSEANTIKGDADYAGMHFGMINKNIEIDSDYGGVRIKGLAKEFENVNIDSNYAGIKIGTSTNNNFNFNVDLSYASFSYPDENITLNKSMSKTTKKYYEGVFGIEENKANIIINSNYGGVVFKLND